MSRLSRSNVSVVRLWVVCGRWSEHPFADPDQAVDVSLVLIQAEAEADNVVAHVGDDAGVDQALAPGRRFGVSEGQEAGAGRLAGHRIDQLGRSQPPGL